MSKFAGFIIGAVEIGIGIATGNVALIVQGGMTIIAQAIVDLTAPKTPAREATEMTIKLGEQPRAILVGEAFTPGSLVDGFDYGGKYGTDWEVLVIRLADEPCTSLTSFYVNDDLNPYVADGPVARYSNQLEIYFRPNTSVTPLPSVVTTHGPGWTSADIGRSGCDVIIAYKADAPNAKHPVWPSGRPRFGFVVKGGKRYDPRKDSTVSGGSGAHRRADPTTWEWSENAIVCWYNYELGIYVDGDSSDQTKLLVGRGLTTAESPPTAIFAAANLCDNVAAQIYPSQWSPSTAVGGQLSPDGTTLYASAGTGFSAFDVATRTQIIYATVPNGGGVGFAIAPVAGGVYVGNLTGGIFFISKEGVESTIVDAAHLGMGVNGVGYAGGSVWAYPFSFTPNVIGEFSVLASTWAVHTVNFNATMVFPTVAGGAIAVGTTSGNVLAIGAAGTAGTLISTAAYGTSGDVFGFDPNDGAHYICCQGGYLFFIDKTTWTIALAVNASIGSSGLYQSFAATPVGASSFWCGPGQYKSADLSLIRTINGALWGTVPGIGGFEIVGYLYDPINDALISYTNAQPGVILRFLDRHGGYRVAGPIYANQPFIDVEQMFAAATAGSIVTRDGSVLIEPGQAKSVVATFTDNDLVVGSKVSWNQGFLSEASPEWLNTVVATYVEPDQKWNSHEAPPLRVNADIAADGKPREAQLSLRLVRYLAQAMRIAETARRMGRIWGRGAVTLGPRFCELEDGDWIQWQSDRHFAGGTKTLRIKSFSIDGKWQNTLTLEEINGSVFADTATFPADYSIPTKTPPPPIIGNPGAGAWTLAAATLTGTLASVPALTITGASDDPSAEAIVVEYWKSDGVTDPIANPNAPPWIMEGTHAPTTTQVEITSLAGGGIYYAAVSYVVSGIAGDRKVLGPVTVGQIDVSPQVPVVDNDVTLASDSATKVPSQHAVKSYVDGKITSVLRYKGSQDCSANPNYPTATKGDAYVVSVAGKIGGASGILVDGGDVFFATADNAGGTQASVGASWDSLEHNLAGALLSANNLADLASPSAARSNLGLAAIAASGSASDLIAGTLPAGRFPALTGDVATVAGALAATLANSGVTAGSYGDATHVPQITVDIKGRITAVASVLISGGGGTGSMTIGKTLALARGQFSM